MMNNLFMSFDPVTNIFNLNWLSVLLPLFFIPNFFYVIWGRFIIYNKFINKFIMNNLKNNVKKSFYKNFIVFILLFNVIYISNLLSLFPFIFTPTSHLVLTLGMSLSLWLSLFLMSVIYDLKNFLIHLVPEGTPSFLCFFMVLIETISNLIRPLTLAIRLMANMVAGHILIILLSSILKLSFVFYSMFYLILNLMIFLEISVSLIQAYVFVILLSMYLGEIH